MKSFSTIVNTIGIVAIMLLGLLIFLNIPKTLENSINYMLVSELKEIAYSIYNYLLECKSVQDDVIIEYDFSKYGKTYNVSINSTHIIVFFSDRGEFYGIVESRIDLGIDEKLEDINFIRFKKINGVMEIEGYKRVEE